MISLPNVIVLGRKPALIAFLVSFSLCQPVSAQEENTAFRQYFEHERTVELSDDKALIGFVGSFDVSRDGAFLVEDPRSQVVWIFGPDGKLTHELSPGDCHPNPDLQPTGTSFVDNRILMFTSRLRAFWFARDGSCTGETIEDFRGPKHITFDTHGNIYGFYTPGPGEEDILKMSAKGEIIRSFEIEKSAFPNATLTSLSGGMTYFDGHVYHARVTGPKIFQYTTAGERTDVFGEMPEYYRPIEEDRAQPGELTPGSPTAGQFYSRHTVPHGLYLLDRDLLLIHYVDSEAGFGLQIYTTDGTLVADTHGFEYPIRAAQEGYVYALSYPDARDDGTVPNPSVVVYRYTGPQSSQF